MGLQCSILGHAFEPAGVEHEREEQGSEVVITEREIERCRRCGAERVVSESTEVTAVVDGSDVGLGNDEPDAGDAPGGGIAGAVDRSGVDADEDTTSDAVESTAGGDETADGSPSVAEAEAEGDHEYGFAGDDHGEPPDPETEDAEILTDDDDETPERKPGQWPKEFEPPETDDTARVVDTDAPIEPPEEESLSGITVPDGDIVCPECDFRIEANSGYREGDSCPECTAWLEAERNQ